MKLTRVKMENFGPYFGVHDIDLSVTETAPVVVIHGENLHGKTSLLNAIRWCLYQTSRDRRNEPIELRELVNYHASDSGKWVAGVEIRFTHDGTEYELKRQMQSTRKPVEDSDFKIVKTLRVGGHFVGEQEVEDYIAGVLHKDISDFFLFDGEMLSRYEDLLADDRRSATVIKRSIEQILGLPALQLIQTDLRDAQHTASRAQTRALESAKRDATLAREAERLREQVGAVSADLKELNEELSKEEDEKERLRQARQQFSDIEAEAQELTRLEGEIAVLTAQQSEHQREGRDTLSQAWWVALTRIAAERLSAVENELSEVTSSYTSAQVEASQHAHLAEALGTGVCPTCGADLVDERRDAIEARVRATAPQPDSLGLALKVADLGQAMRQLREVADSGPSERLRKAEAEYERLGLDIRRKERRMEIIRENLRDHEAPAISSLEHDYDLVIQRIQDIQNNIEEQEANREQIEKEVEQTEAKVRNLPGADPKITTEAGALDAFHTIIDEAIDIFRSKLRGQVESEATAIFRNLIAATDLDQLRINEQFGLTIRNTAGREITTRSAGAEQIVALSLIGALNHCAVREGPVVMDTPFGRLDRSHRENVLGYVPALGTQVILLVQSGEFERERDLVYLGSTIAREYRLEHVDGLSTKTEIHKVA